MKWHKIDLLQSSIEEIRPKKKQNKFRKFILFLAIFAVSIYSFYIVNTNKTNESVFAVLKNITPFNLIRNLTSLSGNTTKIIEGEKDDRINILLLGMGGKGHDGAYLADTIMIGSIKPTTNEASLFSIPRDLVIPVPGYGWRKINNINAFAEAKKENGAEYTRKIVSDLFKIPIQYYIRIDFTGFEKLIDALGGIEVNVEKTLSDKMYPIEGKEDALPIEERYEHLLIPRGNRQMDGKLALKYARSRHGTGGEGSDFARARRQQKVLEAVKKKILSMGTFTNPRKITSILNTLKSHISTNLEIWEVLKFYKMTRNITTNKITRKVLDDSPTGLLQANNYDGAYVLEPRMGDFSEIRFVLKHIFNPNNKFQQSMATIPIAHAYFPKKFPPTIPIIEKPNLGLETATIEIQNGTLINGLARANKKSLKDLGLKIIKIGNAKEQDKLQGFIYDYSNKTSPQTLLFLKKHYKYTVIQGEWGEKDIRTTNANFLLILGP